MSIRVAFNFDDKTLHSLKGIQLNNGFQTLGTALRESIQTAHLVQEEAINEGFTQIILRSRKLGLERVLHAPSLQKGRRNKR